MIHVERPRSLELWHDDRRGDVHEDRLLAVSVQVPPQRRPEGVTASFTDWPLPVMERRDTSPPPGAERESPSALTDSSSLRARWRASSRSGMAVSRVWDTAP
jgi:hypothetical protein